MDQPIERKRAVALRYDREQDPAPRVVAKGEGFVAEAIIAAAREAGVVIESNAMLAGALSNVEVDEEIPVELYEAVARIISYVLRTAAAAKPPSRP
jgi:flagellar biosynthesis protein